MANIKKRNWAAIVYPESAPSDWIDIIRSKGFQCAISPLHDRDIDPTGEAKKPHYHIILIYSGPTSFNVVKKITDELNAPIPQALEQVRGYYRYLTHKDNPDKAQYDENDIKSINGFNIRDYVELTKSEVLEIKKALQDLVRRNNIFEYADLLDFLMDNALWSEYEIACNHTIFIDRYITSRRNKYQKVASLDNIKCDSDGVVIG